MDGGFRWKETVEDWSVGNEVREGAGLVDKAEGGVVRRGGKLDERRMG